MTPTPGSTAKPSPFPPHPAPRTWLLTSLTSPLSTAIARAVLSHGDNVVAGVRDGDRGEDFREWRGRFRGVGLDARIIGHCQAAVAEAVATFGGVDVLFCCDGQALVGTVEELGATARTRTLVREQLEMNFFGPVNIIRAAVPEMRRRNKGHVIVLSSITGHLGTPGLGMYCASGWALEGFCDSLAYEIAPFNVKMTIVQPSMEIGILTNKIVSAPLLPPYAPEHNPTPLFRGIVGGLLDRIQGSERNGEEFRQALESDQIQSLYPKLPAEMKASLIAETVHAILAIGGHENPPARHIVGHEGVTSVKDKLKTVSEELEDYLEVSCAVDIDENIEGTETVTGSGVE